jgi:hypothetical protein
MKKIVGFEIRTARLVRSIAAAALLVSSCGATFAATVGFNPTPKDVVTGDTFNVDIVGSDFTELAGGIINLGFDSTLLTIDSVAVNTALFDFLPDPGGPAVGNTWSGIGFDTFVNNPASGTFTIATLTLTSKAPGGTAGLTILGSSEFYSATAALSPTLLDGTVNISDVPLPAAAWLFFSGLLGISSLARKRATRS